MIYLSSLPDDADITRVIYYQNNTTYLYFYPRGNLNPNSSYLADGTFQMEFTETITRNDRFSITCRRSTSDNKRSTYVKVNRQNIEIVDGSLFINSINSIQNMNTIGANINVGFFPSNKTINYI